MDNMIIEDENLYVMGHQAGIDVVLEDRMRGEYKSYSHYLSTVQDEPRDYRIGFIDGLEEYFE